MAFVPNQGQFDSKVEYLSQGDGYSVYLTRREAIIALRPTKESATGVLRMKVAGSNAVAEIEGLQPLPGKSNYLSGDDPAKWRTNIPQFGKVHYKGIYPGIDLVYYGNQRRLECDFLVAPGGDPATIRLAFDGASKMNIDRRGDLVLWAGSREIRFQRPSIYQEENGRKLAVPGRFVRHARQIGFKIGRYDRSKPLVIDPTVVSSSYIGASQLDSATGIITRKDLDSIWVAGYTFSRDFPTTPGSLSTPPGTTSIFVTKLNGAGTAIVYSTVFGSGVSTGLAVDSAGSAYVTGYGTVPTTAGAYQTVKPGGVDAFVLKLNPAGSALTYSTYVGGSGDDFPFGIALDLQNNAYVTGNTRSTNFPTTPTAYQRSSGLGLSDAFLFKLNSGGSGLIYSTYLGGRGRDESNAVAVDSAGAAYITGLTDSSNFPATPGAFQMTGRSTPNNPFGLVANAFVTKVNPTGTELSYSTFLSGSAYSSGLAIDVDGSGKAFIAGLTADRDFPVTTMATNGGAQSGFVAILNVFGNAMLAGTYLGNSQGEVLDQARGIKAGPDGNVLVTGQAGPSNFGAPVSTNARPAAYVEILNGDLTKVDKIAVAQAASGSAISFFVQPDGTIKSCVVGQADLATSLTPVNGLQRPYGGNSDGFLSCANFKAFPPESLLRPEILVTKTIIPERMDNKFQVGETFTFHIEVQNFLTYGTAYHLDVTDLIHDQVKPLSVTSSGTNCTVSAGDLFGSLKCDQVPRLDPGGLITVDIKVTALKPGGSLNDAMATYLEFSTDTTRVSEHGKVSFEIVPAAQAAVSVNSKASVTGDKVTIETTLKTNTTPNAPTELRWQFSQTQYKNSIAPDSCDRSTVADDISSQLLKEYSDYAIRFQLLVFQYKLDQWVCSVPPAAPGQSTTFQATGTARYPGTLNARVESKTDDRYDALDLAAYVLLDGPFIFATVPPTSITIIPVDPNAPCPYGEACPTEKPATDVTGSLGYGPGWEIGVAPGTKAASSSVSTMVTANPLDDSVRIFGCQAGGCTRSGKLMLPAGSNPFRVQIVDVNGDGIGDVLALNRASGTIGAFLTAGVRILPTPVISPVGAKPNAFAFYSGSDGIVRAAVASGGADAATPGIVTIFTSDGAGNFKPQTRADGTPVTIAAGADPTAIAVADLNGDGNQDLAVVNGGSNTVSILIGDGRGNFTGIADLPVGGGPAAIAVADFNGDGALDLAIANAVTNNVSILRGNGSGAFSAAVNLALPQVPVSIAVADFDGDGFLDMAIAAAGDDVVTLLMGDGTGNFNPGDTYTPGQGPVSVLALDLNGDGKPDLAIASVASSTISFLVKK